MGYVWSVTKRMAGVEVANLDKVFWPQGGCSPAGCTKGDLLTYLEAAAHALVPALRDRPLTLRRAPDGVAKFTFYQKDTARAPAWVRTVTLRADSAGRDVRYAVCNSAKTLLWLGNQAAIELHPWLSRIDHLMRPDLLVFDFDPPEGDFERAVEAALAMREVLNGAGLEGAAKTSGSKGVHIYVPLVRRHDYGAVRTAAVRLAGRLEERLPDLVTTEFKKANRGGRVLVDTWRNAPGAHVIAPYSPRLRAEGTVSFPVPWERLASVRPADFTIATVPPLLAGGRDPWRELLPAPQTLPAPLTGS